MTPSVRTLQGSKQKGFRGSTSLCPRGSNARGFSNYNPVNNLLISPFNLSKPSVFSSVCSFIYNRLLTSIITDWY